MKEETYDERLERMRNYNRAGAPPPGIRSAIGTVGGYKYLEAQKVKLAKQAQGAPKKKNIDTDFDDFSVQSAASAGPRSGAPFTLIGFIDSGSTKIKVRPGMVNNFVPTISGTSIAATPAPSFTVTGASGIIQLKATVDVAGSVTALILESIAGPSVSTDTSTEKYKLVGSWTSSAGVFTSVVSILNANQTLYLCNGTAIWEA